MNRVHADHLLSTLFRSRVRMVADEVDDQLGQATREISIEADGRRHNSRLWQHPTTTGSQYALYWRDERRFMCCAGTPRRALAGLRLHSTLALARAPKDLNREKRRTERIHNGDDRTRFLRPQEDIVHEFAADVSGQRRSLQGRRVPLPGAGKRWRRLLRRQTEKHPPLNRTKTNPISFLSFSPSKRDTISTIASAASQATCTTNSTSYKTPADQNISPDSDTDVASLARLPSFFEDTGYAERRPRAPSYTRPATPSPSLFAFYATAPEPAAQQPAKIHTRLPPLRKAKSASTSLFRVGLGRRERKVSCAAALMVEKSQSRVAMDWSEGDAFMCPRNPPPVPPSPTSQKMPQWALGDEDEPLEVPAYVFERRGSEASTSTNSTVASTKSGSSLTERLAAMLPLPLPTKAKRARSKLSLAMTTDSSPESSTGAWSPVTPPGFAFGFPGQVKSECGYGYEEEDARRVGRVLTPEEDPFAKADIAIEGRNEDSREGMTPTPTPMMRRDNERQYKIVPKKMPAVDGGSAAKAYEMMAEDGPDEVSVAWTFPSSCDIVPARTVAANEEEDEEEDRRQAPTPTLMSMMAERDRRLVSRFSTPSSSAEDGEEAGQIEVEAVVEDTVVVEASAPSQTRLPNPARKSLPSPSPFRYEGKRKASVRTVASEPARVQRPGSPFPLMRDLSDGSCRSMRKAGGKVFGLADDSGVDLGMSVSVNVEREAREQEKGLNDPFVLPVAQAVPMTRTECVKSGDMSVRESVSPDAAEERLTPRPPSASSCIHLPSMDSNATVTPSRLRDSVCSSTDPHPRPQSASTFTPKIEPADADAEWDRRTVASSATGRSRSSTFYSARSSVGSVREVPLKDNA
ncbi:uncharacterized protein LAESUDRAFT_748651 [Laetiporus sulphureus 93-53]|uniref:Uncharacterized protein n=1 Tax=Laetiporus sulphureus 93-53 TaxID=1314785 RepID=A0A165FJT8_9APHY|nr:uncharacterized protein LAESUDRAFT_748651 [Laetiporus sulphureus 93-53]KZT09080.1 hypothetical protein LAESUDRAFT_748651 [Laetiporus sulphureus 93-53]